MNKHPISFHEKCSLQYKTGHRFVKRPALDYFLDMVGYPNFEVVIYTSEGAMTAHPVIDSFDPKQRIMYRLYRDCTKYKKGHHIKVYRMRPLSQHSRVSF